MILNQNESVMIIDVLIIWFQISGSKLTTTKEKFQNVVGH